MVYYEEKTNQFNATKHISADKKNSTCGELNISRRCRMKVF